MASCCYNLGSAWVGCKAMTARGRHERAATRSSAWDKLIDPKNPAYLLNKHPYRIITESQKSNTDASGAFFFFFFPDVIIIH